MAAVEGQPGGEVPKWAQEPAGRAVGQGGPELLPVAAEHLTPSGPN